MKEASDRPKPKLHKRARPKKREKPEEHDHRPVTLEAFERFLKMVTKVTPPPKSKR